MSLRNFSLRKKPKPPSPSTPEILNKNEGSASLKRGDEKRIMLMNMVKEGKKNSCKYNQLVGFF